MNKKSQDLEHPWRGGHKHGMETSLLGTGREPYLRKLRATVSVRLVDMMAGSCENPFLIVPIEYTLDKQDYLIV